MFTNIGRKIKGLAKVLFGITIAIFVLSGISVMITCMSASRYAGEMAGIGFLLFIIITGLGILFAWIATMKLYGYGELISKTSELTEIQTEQTKILNDIRTQLYRNSSNNGQA